MNWTSDFEHTSQRFEGILPPRGLRHRRKIFSKSASKRATVINEDLGYLGTRVSNLQSAVRNLARSAKDSTIVPTRCRNERENFEDEPAYF